MAKRIVLFLAVNILVMATISLTVNLLGIQPYLDGYGIDYVSLLVFCGIFGFGGALVSLMLSKVMAKWMMGVRVIDPNSPGSPLERELLSRVNSLSNKVGLPKLPEVGIYDSPEVNAFATGPSKGNALVAVSTGLLHHMDDAAIDGVLAHEISHVANGDMVTMTLIQGVVNTFVMFLARVIAWGISQALAGNRDERDGHVVGGMVHWIVVMVLEFFLSILGAIVVAYFSRRREFRADAGGANLAGREKMIHALQSLKRTYENGVDNSNAALSTLKISGRSGGLMSLIASHPDLDTRIQALQAGH